jgi:hypothetical protein
MTTKVDPEPLVRGRLEPTKAPEVANPLLAYLQTHEAAPLAEWIDWLRVEREQPPWAIVASLKALTDLIVNHSEAFR